MTDKVTSPRGGIATWAKALLAVSLAFNLLVLGIVVGSHFDGPPKRPPGHEAREGRDGRGGFDPALGPFSRALPEPYRKQALDTLQARAGDYTVDRAELAAQVSRMLDILKAEPFDETALREVMKTQTMMFQKRGEIGRDVVVEQIAEMTPDERTALAQRLEEGFRRAIDRAKP